jgi:hypothetical protein
VTTLAGVLPALQTAYDGLTSYLRALGITATLADYGGFRTQADTTEIIGYRQADYNADLKAGRIPATMTLQQYRPIAPYNKSFHDFGAAFDLKITKAPGGMSAAQALELAGEGAAAYGLRWGGTFTNPDAPHFELDESLAEAAQDYADYKASGGAGGAGGSDASQPGGAADQLAVLTLAGLASVAAVGYVLWRRFHG